MKSNTDSNKKFDFRNVDFDICPISDNPVIKFDCASCKYYHGFSVVDGFPCVECSYNYED